jgi:FKBP-type peptidyl-prolyl cis-trans isomerase
MLLAAAAAAAAAVATAAAAHAQGVAVAPASVPPSGSPPEAAAPGQPPRPSPDEAGYIIGVGLGQQLHQFGVTDEVSLNKILQGVRDGLAGKKAQADDQARVQALFRSISEALAVKNSAKAREFLARNAKAKGVVTTASGLQYKIIAAGDAKAPSPQLIDQVTVAYRGTLLDGTEFDSSQKHGGPATFPVRAVIKGWQEALQLMKPGAKWHLYVPPDLAYGANPRPQIPPGSLLSFDVELLSVKPSPTVQPRPSPAPTRTPPGTQH